MNSDIHDIIIKKLSGHKLDTDMTYVYSRQTDDELLEQYRLKAVDNLTINEENRLRLKVEKLEVEKNQFEKLAAQVAALEQKLAPEQNQLQNH